MTLINEDQLKAEVLTILKTLTPADFETVTESRIRKSIEEKLDLPKKYLSATPYKEQVRDIVDAFLNPSESSATEEAERTPAEESDSEESDVGSKPRAAATRRPSKRPVIEESDDEASEAESSTALPAQNNDDVTSNSSPETKSSPQSSKGSKVPQKRRKVSSSNDASKSPKSKDADIKISEKDEKKIEQLKKYVLACGVRKQWKKEFEGLNGRQRIKKLNDMLAELGIHDRPTLEKCKKVKEKREFEAEVGSLDLGNIITNTRRRRSDDFLRMDSSEGEGSDAEEAKRHSKVEANSDSMQ
ncbi:HIRA-interacting protein 3 [Rhizophlyctis rosea]|nr:HIRA-interacting protein 3 [Rhizophlyctis rosea]